MGRRWRNEEEGGVRMQEVVAIAETEKAVLCVVMGEEVWVPKSVIADDSEVFGEGGEGLLVVQRWFGEKLGWD
jgi:hypothetical protein